MSVTLDKSLGISIYSDVCSLCINKTEGRTCLAFPEGIPDEIWDGKNKHTKPFKGDNGIQFEKE